MYPGFAGRLIRTAARADHVAVRVVTTNPFFTPWLALRRNPHRVPTVALMYDFFPEALRVGGASGALRLFAGFMTRCTRAAVTEADATVFLGSRLARYAGEWYGPSRRAVVIPVGADAAPFAAHPPVALPADGIGVMQYCGNVGRMHDVASLCDLVQKCRTPEFAPHLRLRINASGSGYRQLCRQAGLAAKPGDPVALGGALAGAEWEESMRQAQIGVVSMALGAERVVMPSKAYSALAAGQALLAICPRESDLADLVREHDCGWVVEPRNRQALTVVLREIRAAPRQLHEKRARAFHAGQTIFGMEAIAKRWDRLFFDLQG